MGYDREKYEGLISQSPLFSLDKDKDETAYKRESFKMVEYLYCYLLSINEGKYESFGYEITAVAKRCIKGFSKEKGEFLHYFNSAWKQEYKHIMCEQMLETRMRGIHITNEDKQNVRKYLKYINLIDSSMDEEVALLKLSKVMNLPIEIIQEIAALSKTKVVSNLQKNCDGEEFDIFDQIVICKSNDIDIETITIILSKIEEAFLSIQERQKPIISESITLRVLKILINLDDCICNYTFIDQSILKKYKETGVLPSQRDIAQKHKKNEASISRTVKEFIIKVKERM